MAEIRTIAVIGAGAVGRGIAFAAALGSYRNNPWFVNFAVRLLQGSPDVLRLLRRNPFPAGPPRYIRAQTYRYWFTDFKTGSKTKAWWNRTPRGLYMPAISLEDVHVEGM